jgi:hypothetical protein
MYSTKATYLSAIFMAVAIIIGLVFFGIPDSYAENDKPDSFSGLIIKPENAQPFKMIGTVMEINQGGSPNIVVAEKTILITEFKFGDQVQQAQLTGNYGQTIMLSEIKKGQRVIVNGLKLADDTLIGERIRVKFKRK